jgi:hypothetical protein
MATTGSAGEYERPKDFAATSSPHVLARAVTSTPTASTYDPTPAGHLLRIKDPNER